MDDSNCHAHGSLRWAGADSCSGVLGVKSVVKKTAKKDARPKAVKIIPNAAGNTAKPGTPERKKGSARAVAAPAETALATALAKPEIKKIQGLLKSKTADGVTLGLSLLESFSATRADYAVVFTETVNKSVSRIVNDWLQGGDDTRLDYVRYHTAVVRPAFLATWGQATEPANPFIDLVDIPAGSFTMGSPKDEIDRGDDENQVQVRITQPFRMGRTVVTQGQWRAVIGTEPWCYQGLKKKQCGDDFPAVHVSWYDAVVFCETLTDLEREMGRLKANHSYRLPTEAEWEYACRAGTMTAYSFGDAQHLLNEYGWYNNNSGRMMHAVAQNKTNPWGLFDMHGNVSEWCADWYNQGLSGGNDPAGPATGDYRVRRGGSCSGGASRCRSPSRDCYDPSYPSEDCGFRVVVAS